MTSRQNKIKQWMLKQIFEHTKRFIAWLLGIIGLPAVLLFLKNWFKADHSLTLPGWSWALLFCGPPFLLLALYIAVTKARRKRGRYLTEEHDIIMAISDWLKERKYPSRLRSKPIGPLRIRYDQIDAQCELKPGTAKKFLSTIVKSCSWVEITGEGDKTVALQFSPSISISHSASGQTLRK